MRTLGLLARRARAQSALLVLAATLAALACAGVVAIVGHLDVASRTGLGATFRDAPATSAAVRFTTTLDDPPEAQREAAARILDERLGALPVEVHRSARSVPVTLGGPDVEVVLGSQPPQHVRVTEGRWPGDGTAAAAVPAGLAAETGLSVGDAVTVGDDGPALVVAAVWEPADPRAAVWFDEAEDAPQRAQLPVLLDESALTGLSSRVRVHWTVVPDPAAVRPADLPALRTALDGTRAVLHEDDDVMVLGVTSSGGLGELLASTDAALTAVRGVAVPAAALTALVVVLTFAQVARMLVDARRPETVLLRSRGTTRSALVAASALEGVAVTTTGAVAGAVAGTFLVTVTSGGGPPGAVVGGGVLAVVLAGTLALAAATRAGTGALDGRADVRRRLRGGSLAAGGLVLLAAATALSAWRLAERGSPVRVDAAGRAVLDPVAAAAVPLALVLVALLAATLPGPVAGVRARLAAGRRDLGPVLAARQVARRPLPHATVATFVALAVATAVVAATYTGSWRAHAEDRAATQVGADVRIDAGRDLGEGRAGDAAERLAAVDGATAAVPARVERTAVGSVELRAVALPVAAWDAPGSTEVAGAADGTVPGLVLPAGASTLELEVRLAPDDPAAVATTPVATTAWISGGAGTLRPLALEPDAVEGDDPPPPGPAFTTWRTSLPGTPTGGPWQVVAVEVSVREPAGYRVAVARLVTDAGAPTTVHPAEVAWTAWQQARTPVALDVVDGAAVVPARVVAEARTAPVRLVAGPADPLPVAVSAPLAAGLGLDVGGTTTVAVAGTDVPVEVVAVTPVVAGSGDQEALLTDLEGLEAALLRGGAATVPAAHELWVRTSGPPVEAVSQALVDALGTTPRDVTPATPPPAPLLQPALTVLAAAATATALLAVAGLAAAVRAADRRRRDEERVLVALGVAPARQARSRAAEVGATVLVAALAGGLGGTVVARAAVGTLVRATSGADPQAPAVTVVTAVDTGALTVLVAVAALGAGVVVLGSALGVRARAGEATP